MFQWSKKVVKSVTFNPGVADESLLALVESLLEKDPDKSFSDVCKDALWQSLCVPESVRPAALHTGTTPKPTTAPTLTPLTGAVDQQVAQLQHQIADLEERFFARESNRLEIMESQLMQLSQQVTQLALMVTQGVVQVAPMHPVSSPDAFNKAAPVAAGTFPQEVDPVISRLSQLVDDF